MREAKLSHNFFVSPEAQPAHVAWDCWVDTATCELTALWQGVV